MIVQAIHSSSSGVILDPSDDVHSSENLNEPNSSPLDSSSHSEPNHATSKEVSINKKFVDTEPQHEENPVRDQAFLPESRRLHFSEDQSSGRIIISVIDTETQEIIREIPSEEALRVSEKIQQSNGFFFDKMM